MNKRVLIVFLIIIAIFFSGCDIYQTLYDVPSPVGDVVKVAEDDISVEEDDFISKVEDEVFRVEGSQGEENLEKIVYAAAEAVEHDPFKMGENPLGPFEKGESLGFTLGEWLAASGSGTYSLAEDKAELDLSFENLVPNSVYTIWCSRITFPPDPEFVDKPCGASDGSENEFNTNRRGSADFKIELDPLEESSEETASIIALAYHSDGETYGADPGAFGFNSHVQIFYIIPTPENEEEESLEVELNFVNHLSAGFPEQDVFIEKTELKETMEEEVEETIIAEEDIGDATVIIVEETELISLVPRAEDLDEDSLEFIFTNPLDENGEWKTEYGDNGEYTITVTVSDGDLTSSKNVLIIVNKKEEAPTIDDFEPKETALELGETDEIAFNVEASDLNDDELIYLWKLDGAEVSDEESYNYETTFDDAGSHTIKVTVSDDALSVDNLWSVTVNNVNRKPLLEEISSIFVKETETVEIEPLIDDLDGDEVTFTITDPVGDDGVWETTYEDSGTYKVTVTVSDGTDEVSQDVTIEVENVNRPPQILEIVQK